MKITEIQTLINFISQSALEEVSIETDQVKISVKKKLPVVQPNMMQGSEIPIHIPSGDIIRQPVTTVIRREPSSDNVQNYMTIKSPMVGTFYNAPNPGSPPFVKKGDHVKIGEKIGVIEAMKLFNEIESEIVGTIVKVLIKDATPVEYDQPLFLIDPT